MNFVSSSPALLARSFAHQCPASIPDDSLEFRLSFYPTHMGVNKEKVLCLFWLREERRTDSRGWQGPILGLTPKWPCHFKKRNL